MSHKASQVHSKSVSAVRNISVSFAEPLDAGETLTGTPTAVEETTSDLTIASVAVSTSILTIDGNSVAIGEAITFNVTGGLAGREYAINITCGTTSTPAQTLTGEVTLCIDAD